jgi:prolyl-tRNA editing enzyme YbaK/EbsC (Cys-tRNA(Pro) deacylase)
VGIFAHDWVYGGGGETRTLLKVSPEAIRSTARAAVVDLQSELGA